MDELNTVVYDALFRYFNVLRQFGYKSYGEVDKLIALIALYDLLQIFYEYIDDKDLREISDAIYCLCGTTCLIRFPEQFNEDSLIRRIHLSFIARITEDSNLRETEDSNLREKG